MNKSYILVINCGSSSLKWAVFDCQNQEHLMNGLVEAIGTDEVKAHVTFSACGSLEKLPLLDSSMSSALQTIEQALMHENLTKEMIVGVGHRVVHGGQKFSQSCLITPKILDQIEEVSHLAPLHNPSNILGIQMAQKLFDHCEHIAVFDTSFHQTLQPARYLFALDYDLYTKHGVRRYGFHGTSHQFVYERLKSFLEKEDELDGVISAHLGNGCSLCAIKNGQSVQTTMGLSPLDGLMMGTRSGSVDPSIFDYLEKNAGYSLEQVHHMLNKKSGILGVSQISHDLRRVEHAAYDGDHQAQLALDMFVESIAMNIMKLSIYLPKVDAIIFTGGIGQNSLYVREHVCALLSHLQVKLDLDKNIRSHQAVLPLHEKNTLAVYKVDTDEEHKIAQEVIEIIK